LFKVKGLCIEIKSSSKSVGSFWSDVFGSSQFFFELLILTLQILNFNHSWLYVLLENCIIFVRTFWHVFDKHFKVIFSFWLIQGVLFIDDVFFDVSQCVIQLLNLFGFSSYYFFEIVNLFIKFLFFFIELFLFNFSL